MVVGVGESYAEWEINIGQCSIALLNSGEGLLRLDAITSSSSIPVSLRKLNHFLQQSSASWRQMFGLIQFRNWRMNEI